MPEEVSQPNPVASAPVAAISTPGTIAVNPRTLAFLAAALLGGAGADGAISIFSEPKAPVVLVEKMDRLEAAQEKLDGKVEIVAVAVTDMKADVKIERADHQALKRDVEELKRRVRELELQ